MILLPDVCGCCRAFDGLCPKRKKGRILRKHSRAVKRSSLASSVVCIPISASVSSEQRLEPWRLLSVSSVCHPYEPGIDGQPSWNSSARCQSFLQSDSRSPRFATGDHSHDGIVFSIFGGSECFPLEGEGRSQVIAFLST